MKFLKWKIRLQKINWNWNDLKIRPIYLDNDNFPNYYIAIWFLNIGICLSKY